MDDPKTLLKNIQASLPLGQHLATEYCRDALRRILRYEYATLKNHEDLLEAKVLIFKALRIQAEVPQPWLGLGYLFWLTGASDCAQYYFNQAFRLDGLAETTEMLMAQTQGLPDSPEFNDDFDDNLEREAGVLYDKLEILGVLLHKTIKNLGLHDLPLDKTNLHNLEKYCSSRELAIRHFYYQLDRLEAYLETLSLYHHLPPLEVGIKKLKTIIFWGQRLDKLQTDLADSTLELSAWNKRLQNSREDLDVTELETVLERQMEQISRYESDLDEMEIQEIPIAKLETRLSLLKLLLESLLDLADTL